MGLVLEINLTFWDTLCNHIRRIGNDYAIAVGDWNAVLNMNLDTHYKQNNFVRPRVRKKVLR